MIIVAMTVNGLHVACPHMFYSCSGGWGCLLQPAAIYIIPAGFKLSKLLHAPVGLASRRLYVST
jgi:hypothetical protein